MSFSCSDLVNAYDIKTPPQTNLQCWLNYCRYVESPNSFIVFSFLTAVGAALQRRVWKDHNTVRLYPNIFTVLVGEASTGKGRVIKPLKGILKSYKNDNSIIALDAEGNQQSLAGIVPKVYDPSEEFDRSEEKAATMDAVADKAVLADDLLFPIPADSSSLRAVSSYLSQSGRTIYYTTTDSAGKIKKSAYLHSSAFFVLEEIVSLFKDKHETKDMVDFLVQTWDAGDYRHATYGHGIDNILNCCVSMLAGTTPDSMEDLFGSRLLKEGLSSRTLFVFEEDKRFRHFCTEDTLLPEQIAAYKRLKIWFRKLASVYGPVKFTPESIEYLRVWYEENFETSKINQNSKLSYYYGRKDMHIMKLAMAIHFSEKLDRTVTLDDVKLAHSLLDSIEPNMHLALRITGRNDAAPVIRKLTAYIGKHGPINANLLWMEFCEDVKSMMELKEMLSALKEVGKITTNEKGQYIKYDRKAAAEAKKAGVVEDLRGLIEAQTKILERQKIKE